MVHRGIATLAGLTMFCYILLSHFDPDYFLMHLYQSLIYLVIILMLFYFEDHFAYMLGMLAPAASLIMMFALGLISGGMRQVWWVFSPPYAGHKAEPVALMAAVTTLMALLMIGFSAYRWKREYAGVGKGLSTFLISLGVVVVYDGVLIFWFIRSFGIR
jgi:hypothetical protein